MAVGWLVSLAGGTERNLLIIRRSRIKIVVNNNNSNDK